MQYRKFGSLDWKVSALGFGCMRLPTDGTDPMNRNIDEQEAIRMIRHAIDQGVNYFDSAYVYHGGNSEIVLGKALKDGYREKVRIATKLPMPIVQEAEDFDRMLNEQLKRLQVDTIDFYLLHGLRKNFWELAKRLDLISKAEKAVKDGRIRYIGFSFHDSYPVLEDILNSYDGWKVCQIQYNYMDTENQAGTKGLQLAASKGIAVSIMEPLLGGKLASPPKEITRIIETSEKKYTPADLAFQWLWNQPEISVVLSGMSTMEQLKENIYSASKSGTDSLSPDDLKLVEKVKEGYLERAAVPCTGCRYCMPCPNDVAIPDIFKLYNGGIMLDSMDRAKGDYNMFWDEKNRASSCVQCGTCEEKCPQKIPIRKWLADVQSVLGQNSVPAK